jgi:hypothetical protein
MNVKQLRNKISKFPANMLIYLQSNWSLFGVDRSGFAPLQSVTSGVPVKSLKNGLLKDIQLSSKNPSTKTTIIVFETGDVPIQVSRLLFLLNTIPGNWLVTTQYIVAGSKPFVGFIELDYEFKVSCIKKQKEYDLYDENSKGKRQVLLLKERY